MTRNRWLAAAVIALVAVGMGGYLAYDQFLRGDDVAPLSLASSSPSAGASAAADAASPSPGLASASPADASDPVSAAALAGTWTIGDGSVAGYRVREKLASLPAQSDAVGRTEAVTGEATLVAAGGTVSVSAARFEVDLTTLTSDEGRRDARLREMGIESARYPTAALVLTAPLEVPAEGLSGATVDVVLTGELDLHGVTKAVAIPVQARLTGGRIEVAGSLTFPFADFAMTPPSVGSFVTVGDDATLEFLIILAKA